MASNISTPQKITAKSDSFAERFAGERSNNQTENGNNGSSNEGKSGRALPELGGKDEQVVKAGFSFDQIREKVATLLHSLGLGGGDATATQNLETTEVGRVMAGGTSNTATIAATAQKVGIEAPQQPPQQKIADLSPDILALARNEKSVIQNSGAGMDKEHGITFAGVARPPETSNEAVRA